MEIPTARPSMEGCVSLPTATPALGLGILGRESWMWLCL